LESNNKQIIDLTQKVDCLKNENKCLRDQNDELVIELEATKRYILTFMKCIFLFFCDTFRIDNLDADKSFESNIRNFLAEENSPNCFGKANAFPVESSVEEAESVCTNTSETYTIESDFEMWNKVNLQFNIILCINLFINIYCYVV